MSDPISTISQALTADMARLRTVSQNIANMNTPGYRATRTYAQPFVEQVQGAEGTATLAPAVHDFVTTASSSFRETGRTYDFAAEGQGFFVIQDEAGLRYTKNGAFHVDSDGRLVTAQGRAVLGEAGPIQLAAGPVTVDAEGNILQSGQAIARLRVVDLPDSYALKPVGDGSYRYEGMPVEQPERVRVRQGSLENGNTQPALEMVEMLELQRHFESTQRSMVAYDQMLNVGINTLGNSNN